MFVSQNIHYSQHLLSLSIIVTVAWAIALVVTFLGREFTTFIVRIKFSFISKRLSLIIVTSNEAFVSPAGNVTAYGPEL